ncbi:hypothetical protein F4604DRAFT_659978 [Suillus subluteus]|nr:hypothetical protein F4604DRAFT_659978 [Suillus subluteus]
MERLLRSRPWHVFSFGRGVEQGYLKVLFDARVVCSIRISVTRILCWRGRCQDEPCVACGIGVMLLLLVVLDSGGDGEGIPSLYIDLVTSGAHADLGSLWDEDYNYSTRETPIFMRSSTYHKWMRGDTYRKLWRQQPGPCTQCRGAGRLYCRGRQV